MNILMEFVLILRVVMIWTQNYFWYMPNQFGWLCFFDSYQVLANVIPLLVFLYVVVEQIRSANIIKLRNHKQNQRLSYQSTNSLNESEHASSPSQIISRKSNNNTEIYESFVSSENDVNRLEDIQGFGKYFILR